MHAVLTEEQQAIAEAARDLAAGGLAGARALTDGAPMPEQPTKGLFEGFNGLGVPESDGGAGGTLVDLAVVVRELGRAVTPTPWLTHQLALQVASAAGLSVEEGMRADARWVLVDDDPSLVRHGVGATLAVVVDGDGVSLHPVAQAERRQGMDASSPMAEIGLGPELAAADHGGREGLLRARAVLAASQAGTGLGAIERATAYAGDRQQFGQPIGIFQGVAHQFAEAWTHVELAWSLALYACWSVGEGMPDAPDAVDAAVAKAGNAAIFAAERGMQVHGGIGITWEADPHLALRRAMADDAWLGSAREAERSLGMSLLLAP